MTESKQEYPRLENGQIDFMTMVENTFPGQIQVASYVKGLMRGYALDKSLQTAQTLMTKLDEGNTSVTMADIIPEEIRPDSDKDTQKDIG
jgi:hypothetical protein